MKTIILLLTILLSASVRASAPDTRSDLETLSAWMTGSFSSAAQAAADTNYFDIRLRMAPIWTERTDARWLYVEQATAGAQERPYRQRVYRVTAGEGGAFRSEVYALPGPKRFAGAWRRLQPLRTLTPDSLLAREGCAVILRRDGDDRFAGGTDGRACASDLRGAVYATSEVTISPDVIASWDRGFAADGSQAWGATGGGYVFRREPLDAPWPVVARAAWLAGRWETGSPGERTEEQWLPPCGDTMMGVSRTVEGGRLAWFEMMVLIETENGLMFEAHPAHQPSVRFPAVTVTDSLLVFENRENAFPKVIGYRRTAEGLSAWIEGGEGEVRRRVDYVYRRVAP